MAGNPHLLVIAECQGSGKSPYRISYHDQEGYYACSCPAWTKGKHHREDCKHIDDTKRLLSNLPAELDTWLTLEGADLRTKLELAMAYLNPASP